MKDECTRCGKRREIELEREDVRLCSPCLDGENINEPNHLALDKMLAEKPNFENMTEGERVQWAKKLGESLVGAKAESDKGHAELMAMVNEIEEIKQRTSKMILELHPLALEEFIDFVFAMYQDEIKALFVQIFVWGEGLQDGIEIPYPMEMELRFSPDYHRRLTDYLMDSHPGDFAKFEQYLLALGKR